MFGLFSLFLSLPALFLVSGVLDLPLFYGMSVGLVACALGVVELMGSGGEEEQTLGRKASYVGISGGGLAVMVGLALYVGIWIWASK